MEIRTFQIRLKYTDKTNTRHYVDELPDDSGLRDLRCCYNWIKVGAGYSPGSRDYNIRQAHHRINYGYTDEDVTMECTYEKGKINITLVAADSFNRLITCVEEMNKLVTRTLFDWVKLEINGCYSDGVGENEVAYLDLDGETYDVWLRDFITDEPTDEWGFKVSEPISTEINLGKVESFFKPGYKEKYSEVLKNYNSCFGESRKILDEEGCSKYSDELEELIDENILYMATKLC